MKSWLVLALLVALAALTVLWLPASDLITDSTLRGTITGTLTGALLGAAGSMLGATLNRAETRAERAKEREEDHETRQRERRDDRRERNDTRGEDRAIARMMILEEAETICALVAEELVNTATGHIVLLRYLRRHIERPPVDGVRRQILLDEYRIRPMPLTQGLGAKLVILGPASVSGLVAILSSLAHTDATHRQCAAKEMLTVMDLQTLAAWVRSDMTAMAELFERIAPERQIQLANEAPSSASNFLRAEVDQG